MLSPDKLNNKLLEDCEAYFPQVLKEDIVEEAYQFVLVGRTAIESSTDEAWGVNLGLKSRWQQLLWKNMYIIFASLSEATMLKLIEDHLDIAIACLPELDLWSKMRLRLVALPDFTYRDELKRKVSELLRNNDRVQLTARAIIVQDRSLPPTVKSWILDYIIQVGTGPLETLVQTEYFTSSKNMRTLIPVEREKVVALLSFYERLQRSSLTPAGLEDTPGTVVDGKSVTFKDGQFQEINLKIKRMVEQFRKVGLLEEYKEEVVPTAVEQVKTLATSASPPPLKPSLAPRVVSPTPPRVVPPPAAPRPVATAQVIKTTMSAAKTSVAKEAAPVPAVVSAPAPKPKETPSVAVPAPAAAAKPVFAPPLRAEPQPTAGLTAPSLLASAAVVAEEKRLLAVSTPEKLHDEIWLSLARRSQASALAALKLLAASAELLNILKTDSRFYYALANYYRVRHDLNALKDFHMSFANPRYTKELVKYILEQALKVSASEAAHVGIDLENLMKERGVRLEHWGYWDEGSKSYKWL